MPRLAFGPSFFFHIRSLKKVLKDNLGVLVVAQKALQAQMNSFKLHTRMQFRLSELFCKRILHKGSGSVICHPGAPI